MHQLPQLERRPSLLYVIGHGVGRSCLTASFAANFLRLAGIVLLVPALLAVVAGKIPWLALAGAGAALIISVVWRPGTKRTGKPHEQWTTEERRIAKQAVSAERIVQVLGEGAAQLAVDYGVSRDQRPLLVAPTLRRAHQLMIGGSGVGKSKFIATQAAQAAVLGSVVAVVDPHEELAQDILCAAAPVLAERGVILLWPDGPTGRVYPWNPLWTGPGREAWQAADLVVAAVKRVWKLSDANTYIINVLQHTAWALAGAGWTLTEGAHFLTDDQFRDYVAGQGRIPEVQRWIEDYDRLSLRDRRDLTQTTLVRLQRLNANPHLKRLFGCGVSDPNYQRAMGEQGVTVTPSTDLVGDINRGVHLFAVAPKRVLGEDQFLLAGMVQSAILTAALCRRPNDPAMPELEAYLDEAGAYANAEGLGVVLAQARKYKLTAIVAMQGLTQAEPALVGELERNTAIKTIFATDNPDEAARSAAMLFPYHPELLKMDNRQRVKLYDKGERRETGHIQTYTPQEQLAFFAGTILTLLQRQYILKIRGEGQTPLFATTPEYNSRFDLEQAVRLVQRKRRTAGVAITAIDRELAARQAWLDANGWQQTHIEPVLTSLTATASLPLADTQPSREASEPDLVQHLVDTTPTSGTDVPTETPADEGIDVITTF